MKFKVEQHANGVTLTRTGYPRTPKADIEQSFVKGHAMIATRSDLLGLISKFYKQGNPHYKAAKGLVYCAMYNGMHITPRQYVALTRMLCSRRRFGTTEN